MAAADLRAQADRAFVDEEYDSALSLYTKAISAAPNDAGLHDARAQCHLKLRDYTEAVQDASRAVELDPSHAKAHLRLGQAFFHLEEYEAARDTLEKGQRLDAGNAQFATWIRKCNAELAEEGAAAAPSTAAPAAAVRPTADASRPTTDQPHKPAEPAASAKPAAPAPAPSPATSAPAAAGASSAPLAPAAPVEFEGKYRHQWYQLQDKVSVDIYAKGLSKEQVSCEFAPTHLKLVITTPEGAEDYVLDKPLYSAVDPASCRYEVLRTKVEVVMRKANNLQWASLEPSTRVACPSYADPAAAAAPRTYPSSQPPKKAKDWDKVESELKAMEEKGELEDGDPLNNFFKKIFGQGDDDTRRAMMKSFTESGGTVLSTNWKEVGAKKVEYAAPAGEKKD